MNAIAYLLIPLILFVWLLYPLFRKMIRLLEILVHKILDEKEKVKTDDAYSQYYLLAHERIILLVERLKPDSLIPRCLKEEMNCREFQLLLLKEIRQEFEYNLSRQLYLSEKVWGMTVNYKDRIITLVNTSAAACSPDSAAANLAQKILQNYLTSEIGTGEIIRLLKQEVHKD